MNISLKDISLTKQLCRCASAFSGTALFLKWCRTVWNTSNSEVKAHLKHQLLLPVQRSLIQTKLCYRFFFSVWKETVHKPLKLAAVKNVSSSVYVYRYNLLRSRFLLPCDNWKTSLSLLWDFFKCDTVSFFKTSISKEVHIMCYLHNNNKKQSPDVFFKNRCF